MFHILLFWLDAVLIQLINFVNVSFFFPIKGWLLLCRLVNNKIIPSSPLSTYFYFKSSKFSPGDASFLIIVRDFTF